MMKRGGAMSRPDITRELTEALRKYLNPHNDTRVYMAREVTFDYATGHCIRVDYMKFEPISNTVSGIERGRFYCYEVKSSVEDFRSKNGHNFIGDYNYYVMPEEVFEAVEKDIPWRVGVLTPTAGELWNPLKGERWNPLKIVKKARRQDRDRPASMMLLMMFRSSNRDKEREEYLMRIGGNR